MAFCSAYFHSAHTVGGVFPRTCLHLSSAAFLSVSACSALSMAFSLSSFNICIFFLIASILAEGQLAPAALLTES